MILRSQHTCWTGVVSFGFPSSYPRVIAVPGRSPPAVCLSRCSLGSWLGNPAAPAVFPLSQHPLLDPKYIYKTQDGPLRPSCRRWLHTPRLGHPHDDVVDCSKRAGSRDRCPRINNTRRATKCQTSPNFWGRLADRMHPLSRVSAW